jgi:hypothetical protein
MRLSSQLVLSSLQSSLNTVIIFKEPAIASTITRNVTDSHNTTTLFSNDNSNNMYLGGTILGFDGYVNGVIVPCSTLAKHLSHSQNTARCHNLEDQRYVFGRFAFRKASGASRTLNKVSGG